jgi:hypothetical protein
LKELEDEADTRAPQAGQFRFGEAGRGAAVDEDFAARGEVHRPGEVEQRGLAAAAAPEEGGHGAFLSGKRDTVQHLEVVVVFGDVAKLKHDAVSGQQWGRRSFFVVCRPAACGHGGFCVSRAASPAQPASLLRWTAQR